MNTAPGARAWCYYRNLVHTVYREARHIGASGDPEARLIVDDPDLRKNVANIRRWRYVLKGLTVFTRIEHASSTTKTRKPYEEMIGLSIEQLAELFGRPGWTRTYGGQKWRSIALETIALGQALDDGDGETAEAVCDRVRIIRHNSGPLVPETDADQIKEKWPVLCDIRREAPE